MAFFEFFTAFFFWCHFSWSKNSLWLFVIEQRKRKNIAKLQTKYLSKLPLTKGSILHKSCREVFHFLLCNWIWKKYFDIFKSEIFFFTGSSTYLEIWVTMREISSFSKSLTRRGGEWKKCYSLSCWLNSRIPLFCFLGQPVCVLHWFTKIIKILRKIFLFLFYNDIQRKNVQNKMGTKRPKS